MIFNRRSKAFSLKSIIVSKSKIYPFHSLTLVNENPDLTLFNLFNPDSGLDAIGVGVLISA